MRALDDRIVRLTDKQVTRLQRSPNETEATLAFPSYKDTSLRRPRRNAHRNRDLFTREVIDVRRPRPRDTNDSPVNLRGEPRLESGEHPKQPRPVVRTQIDLHEFDSDT